MNSGNIVGIWFAGCGLFAVGWNVVVSYYKARGLPIPFFGDTNDHELARILGTFSVLIWPVSPVLAVGYFLGVGLFVVVPEKLAAAVERREQQRLATKTVDRAPELGPHRTAPARCQSCGRTP